MYGTAIDIDDNDDKAGAHMYLARTMNAIISKQFYLLCEVV